MGRKSSSDSSSDLGCLGYVLIGGIYLLYQLFRFVSFLFGRIVELCNAGMSLLADGAQGVLNHLGGVVLGTLSLLFIVFVIIFAPRLFRAFDDFVYYVQNNILVCPKCHSVLKRVGVKCPVCNVVYDNLFPMYGHFFYMKCRQCGTKLATTRLFGRTKYESYCMECRSPLGVNASEGKVVAIPIAGGAASGKTTFLMSSLETLTYEYPEKRKWHVSFPYKDDAVFANRLKKYFRKGERPDKTPADSIPDAFCIDYETGRFRESLHLCVYDPAGEFFAGAYDKLKASGYYDFMSGLIFIIDPFSLPVLKKHYQQSLRKKGENFEAFDVSDVDPTSCVERLIHRFEGQEKSAGSVEGIKVEGFKRHRPPTHETLAGVEEKNLQNRADTRFHDVVLKPLKELPCAIVITKADGYDLDRFIGEKGVRAFREKHPQYDDEEAMDIVCRYWLRKWGGQNILGVLGNKFGQTRCFAVSALGKTDKCGNYPYGFQPYNMDAPFNWILNISGRRGLNKWGVLVFLFWVAVAIGAIAAIAVHLVSADSSVSVSKPSASFGEIDPASRTSKPSPVSAPSAPEPDDSVARNQFRYLCYEVYDKSAEAVGFDRDAVLSSIDSAGSSSGFSVRELDALKTAPTLELVVQIRKSGGNIESARSQVNRVEEAAQSALFDYFADESIEDAAARNQRDNVRDVAFKNYERCAQKVSFDRALVVQRVQYAALAAKLNDEALNVVGSGTLADFLSNWHKFDKAFRAWETGKTGEDVKRASEAAEEARKEIKKILRAAEEDVVYSK